MVLKYINELNIIIPLTVFFFRYLEFQIMKTVQLVYEFVHFRFSEFMNSIS